MKISQIIVVILIALIAGFGGAKLADKTIEKVTQIAPQETAYERVLRTGTIHCGYALSPVVMTKDPNTGQLGGFNVDLWKAIGNKLGLKIDWAVETGWGVFVEDLKTNKYDAFCGLMWPNAPRMQQLALSMPVLYSFVNLYARADDHRFDDHPELVDQADVTTPVIDNDISEAMAKERFPNAKRLGLGSMSTWSETFLTVVSGKTDVILLDQNAFEDLNKKQPGALHQVSGIGPLFTFPSAYGFNADDTKLRDMVDTALRILVDDGTVAAMAKRYSPYYGVPKPSFDMPTP